MQTGENNVDPDQMPQNVASDQGLHCSTHPAVFIQIKRKLNELFQLLG